MGSRGVTSLNPDIRVFAATILLILVIQMSLLLGPTEGQIAVQLPHVDKSALQSAEIDESTTVATHSQKGPKAIQISKSNAVVEAPTPWRPPVVNLKYQGGPVMCKPIRVYLIWYGTWDAATQAVIRTAISSLTPATPIKETPNLANWWKIVTKYTQANGCHVSNSVSIGGEVTDFYSMGNDLGNVATDIVLSNINPNGSLPHDPVQGLYMLMTSSDVSFQQGGFCGFHNYFCIDKNQLPTSAFCSNLNNRIIWSFMPFPGAGNNLLPFCTVFEPFGTISLPAPNDAASPVAGALDSYISSMMHEIMESATDPYINAWIHNLTENSEAGDLCAYSYGRGDFYYCGLPSIYGAFHGSTDFTVCESYPRWHALRWVATGEIFNLFGVGGSKFLVQKIWSLANKGCQLQLQEPCKAATTLTAKKGVIERGVHVFGSIPIQTYGPGEHCEWKIRVPNAKTLTLNFVTVGTGYDQLDHVNVYKGNILLRKISGLGTSAVIKIAGNSAVVRWTSYGGRSPFPDATGFRMTYTST